MSIVTGGAVRSDDDVDGIGADSPACANKEKTIKFYGAAGDFMSAAFFVHPLKMRSGANLVILVFVPTMMVRLMWCAWADGGPN